MNLRHTKDSYTVILTPADMGVKNVEFTFSKKDNKVLSCTTMGKPWSIEIAEGKAREFGVRNVALRTQVNLKLAERMGMAI